MTLVVKYPPGNVSATLDTTTRTSDAWQPHSRPFDVNVRGVFVANLRLQVSRDAGVNWDDYFVFTQPDVLRVVPTGDEIFQLTMAGGGDFTSGSAGIFMGA